MRPELFTRVVTRGAKTFDRPSSLYRPSPLSGRRLVALIGTPFAPIRVMKIFILLAFFLLNISARAAHFCDVHVEDDEFLEVKDFIRKGFWNPVSDVKAPGMLKRFETIRRVRVNYGENGLKTVASVTYVLYLNRGGGIYRRAWYRSFSESGNDDRGLMDKAYRKAFFWLRLESITRCD
jgi:hypothetical protein